MKKPTIICSSILVLLLAAALVWFVGHRFLVGRPIVWDFRSSRDPSVIGWKPTGPSDKWYQEPGRGNIDFTLITPGDRNGGVEGSAHTFHQTCWAIGCETDKGRIVEIYAHFGHNVKVTDATVIARQALLDWYDGEDKIWYPKGDPTITEWLKGIAAGTDTRDRYLIRAGGISIAINMTGGAFTEGLNRTCNMTLEVGVKP